MPTDRNTMTVAFMYGYLSSISRTEENPVLKNSLQEMAEYCRVIKDMVLEDKPALRDVLLYGLGATNVEDN